MADMNFAPRPSEAWSEQFENIIDVAMQAENRAQKARSYLGASRLGEDCLRKLAFEFHGTPKDEGREFKGKILRIFERGHTGEELMIRRLRLAGFHIVTEKAGGGQIGFKTGWNEEKQCHLIAGHCDGVITSAPPEAGLATPSLWECKILGDKSWNDTLKKGVRASKPVYFAQMQLYMAYLDLTENPGLFTAENGNTGQIYAERVPFDKAAAQEASDKGVKVVSSTSPEEMPRVARESTDFRCRFCDFKLACWTNDRGPNNPPDTSPEAWAAWGKK
jgi:hypothetical protein